VTQIFLLICPLSPPVKHGRQQPSGRCSTACVLQKAIIQTVVLSWTVCTVLAVVWKLVVEAVKLCTPVVVVCVLTKAEWNTAPRICQLNGYTLVGLCIRSLPWSFAVDCMDCQSTHPVTLLLR